MTERQRDRSAEKRERMPENEGARVRGATENGSMEVQRAQTDSGHQSERVGNRGATGLASPRESRTDTENV